MILVSSAYRKCNSNTFSKDHSEMLTKIRRKGENGYSWREGAELYDRWDSFKE